MVEVVAVHGTVSPAHESVHPLLLTQIGVPIALLMHGCVCVCVCVCVCAKFGQKQARRSPAHPLYILQNQVTPGALSFFFALGTTFNP
jgi:hypothetical protein